MILCLTAAHASIFNTPRQAFFLIKSERKILCLRMFLPANIFDNVLFDSLHSLISNSSKIPSYIQYLTDNRLSSVSFSLDKIKKVIQNLDPNKVHGHDNINIRMLKVCGPSNYKPVEIIFNQCLETGVFPSEWEKGNIVPVHKKGDKQTLKNCRPVSLLPICGEFLKD